MRLISMLVAGVLTVSTGVAGVAPAPAAARGGDPLADPAQTVGDLQRDPSGTSEDAVDYYRCELGGLGLGGCGGGGATDPGAGGQTASDKLFAYLEEGVVAGRLTPNAPFRVDVLNGGSVKATASGTTDAEGDYSAFVPWHDGIGEGLHRGDTVRVVDQAAGRTYSQPVGLAGTLEEHTGKFTAVTLPRAKVTATLLKVFARDTVLGEKTVTADANGRVSIDWSTVHSPSPQADRPAWRGYDVIVAVRTVPGQGQQRELSTVSPTLANTLNQGGGGNFMPGDNVTLELWRDGVLRDSKSTVANAEGIPRALFSVDVGQGDMMRTRYHDASGAEQFIDMAPWTLTADVDLVTKTISGMAAPNVPVAGIIKNPGEQTLARGVAGSDGRYTLQFASMAAGSQLSVWRVADAGNTGVAVQQQLMHTPIIRVDDVTAEVRGNGAHGVNDAVIDVVRNGTTVFSKTVATTKAGKFGTTLKTEIVPGDAVRVTTGTKVVGPFAMSPHRFTTHGLSGNRVGGTGAPGRRVTVGRTGCLVSATVGVGGTWEATPSGCTLAPTDVIIALEEETSGPAVGSTRGHFQWTTSPDVQLTAPGVGAVGTGSPVTINARAFDTDDGVDPAAVRFYVDGRLAFIDAAAPYGYSAVLPAGAHTVVAEAVDSGQRRDAANNEIVTRTAVRYFRV